ncbi:MAG: hypothetical protein ACOYL5_18520 [Phototrophicaceae bacterium]
MIPPVLLNNAVFALEVRRVRGWQDAQSPLWIGLHAFLWGVAGVFVPLSVGVCASYLPAIQAGNADFAYALVENAYTLTDYGLIAALLAGFVLDYVLLWQGVYRLNARRNIPFEELFSLTLFTLPDWHSAQHAVSRLHGWRWTCALVGVRLGLTLWYMLAVELAGAVVLDGNPQTAFDGLTTDLPSLISTLTLVIFYGILVLEPFWRARIITGLALALTRYVHHFVWGLAVGMGFLLCFQAAQWVWVIRANRWVYPLVYGTLGYNVPLWVFDITDLIALIVPFSVSYAVIGAAVRWLGRAKPPVQLP